MLLREYESKDGTAIAGWIRNIEELYSWSADRYCRFPLTGSDIDKNYANMQSAGKFFPLTAVEDDGSIAGHFIIRYPDKTDKSTVRFGFVIVDPALRGQGKGSEMLRLGIEYARRELSAKRIDLGVFADNVSAACCYKAVGFKEFGREIFPMPAGDRECILMELIL